VVTCPECGAQVRVVPGPPSWADAEPDPVPTDPDWFVLVQKKQVGPLDARGMVERIRSGEVHGRTFVWRDGFDGWRKALEVPELIPLLEDAGVAATPPHGPLTPADGLSPPGAPMPRASTPSGARGPPAGFAVEEETLELAREPRRRTTGPDSVFVRSLHRRSPWKLVLALSAALALPVGGLALFASLRRAPIIESHAEAEDARPQEPVPSAPVRRVKELRDLLLGTRAPPAPPPPAPKRAVPELKPSTTPPARTAPDGPKTAELRALYGEGSKADVGPRVRRSETSTGPARGSGGPSNEEVARVVGQTQSAFQSCIEQQLRKHPGFKGGKVNLIATVGSSGIVKQAQLDRHDLDASDVGECLKARAKRMVFSAFTGEDVDVEIPLVLTTTL
jgi:GYF domain 2